MWSSHHIKGASATTGGKAVSHLWQLHDWGGSGSLSDPPTFWSCDWHTHRCCWWQGATPLPEPWTAQKCWTSPIEGNGGKPAHCQNPAGVLEEHPWEQSFTSWEVREVSFCPQFSPGSRWRRPGRRLASWPWLQATELLQKCHFQ